MCSSLNTVLYCKAVEDKLRFLVVDRENGYTIEFRKLFFPVRIADGYFAYKQFEQRISNADERIDPKTRAFGSSMRDPDETKTRIERAIKKALEERANETITAEIKAKTERELTSSSYRNRGMGYNSTIEDKCQNADDHSTLNLNDDEKLSPPAQYESDQIDISFSSVQTNVKTEKEKDNRGIRDELNLDTRQRSILYERNESLRDKLLWNDIITGKPSKVIALASAGYGKTTLINRIALFYCSLQIKGGRDAEDSAPYGESLMIPYGDSIMVEKTSKGGYALPVGYSIDQCFIPCIIRLRENDDNCYSVEGDIIESIRSIMSGCAVSSIYEWVNSVRDRLLLLIDGLDEVPEGRKAEYLKAIEEYLEAYPNTGVIITSRVAGLAEEHVYSSLGKMGFHGRTIMPLTDNEVVSYCTQWITETQSSEGLLKDSYIRLIEDIQTQKKYEFLRDFMRTPLELTVILRQIVRNSLSTNKWSLFYDMLWEQVTGHLSYDDKQKVFDDTMTVLGIIAYNMQLRETLYISRYDISQILDILNRLNFQTREFFNLTIDSVWEKMDRIASNIGILEKDDTRDHPVFTFPIRAYQEFLTAYACCHIRLDTKETRPNPLMAIIPHISESWWGNVVEYALSDMETNSMVEAEPFKLEVFQKCTDLRVITNVVSSGFYVSVQNAEILCQRFLESIDLDDDRKQFLAACILSKSAYSFRRAITGLFKLSCQNNPWVYLDAMAYMYCHNVQQNGDNLIKNAEVMLESNDHFRRFIGAGILSLVAREVLGEGLDDISIDIERSAAVDEKQVRLLYKNAVDSASPVFVCALTDLWLSRISGSEAIYGYLDKPLLSIVLAFINRMHISVCAEGKSLSAPKTFFFRKILNVLGTLPPYLSIATGNQKHSWQLDLCKCFYQLSMDDLDMDQIALLVAEKHLGCEYVEFIQKWIWDICKGQSSRLINKKQCKLRERNHFELVRIELYPEEKQAKAQVIQGLSNQIVASPFNEVIRKAEEYYCNKYGDRDDAIIKAFSKEADFGILSIGTATNLAFLVRNGSIDVPSCFGSRTLLLYALLLKGIIRRNSYSILNMALLEIEKGNTDYAEKLLSMLTITDWEDTVNNWWFPQLWEKEHTQEGAIVCMLANRYAQMRFDDLAIMRQMVRVRINKGE